MADDSVLATFDPERTYSVHWTDDLVTTHHRIVGARTDDNGRPYALLARNPRNGARTILNWDKIASMEEEPQAAAHDIARKMHGG